MNRILVAVVLLVAANCPPDVWAEHTPERAHALAAIRAALAGRSLADANTSVERAVALKGEVEYDTELLRLEMLAKYVVAFWEAVDKGAMKSLNAGELMVGKKLCSVVDYDRRLFVIRSEGENKRYTLETIPAQLALVLSQLHLPADIAANKVYFGAFLAMDAKGDRQIAQQYWQEAARGGAEVQSLLPELQLALAAAAIPLPEVSPAMRAALQPAQWQWRFKKADAYQREPLGKRGAINSEGRLEIAASEDPEAAVLGKARISGDFSCRVVLSGVVKGQSFGMYSALPSETPVLLELPAGTVQVEFMRKKGVFYARVNEKDVLVEPAEKTAGKMAGYLGVSLASGKALLVAGFEAGK